MTSTIGFDHFSRRSSDGEAVTFERGALVADFTPILGERANGQGIYDIFTPVLRVDGLRVDAARITVSEGRKVFTLDIDAGTLTAFAGSYGATGERSSVGGWLNIGGERIDLPATPLDPSFDQADFALCLHAESS